MNNKRKNLQDSINKAMNTPIESAEKPYVPEQIDNESVFVPNNEQPQVTSIKKEKTPFDKLIKTTGIVLLVASIFTFRQRLTGLMLLSRLLQNKYLLRYLLVQY